MMTSVVLDDQLTSNSGRKTSATCSKLADTNCRRQFPSKDIQKSNVSSAYLGCSGNGSTIPNFYVRRSVLINSQRLTPRSPKVLHQTYLRPPSSTVEKSLKSSKNISANCTNTKFGSLSYDASSTTLLNGTPTSGKMTSKVPVNIVLRRNFYSQKCGSSVQNVSKNGTKKKSKSPNLLLTGNCKWKPDIVRMIPFSSSMLDKSSVLENDTNRTSDKSPGETLLEISKNDVPYSPSNTMYTLPDSTLYDCLDDDSCTQTPSTVVNNILDDSTINVTTPFSTPGQSMFVNVGSSGSNDSLSSLNLGNEYSQRTAGINRKVRRSISSYNNNFKFINCRKRRKTSVARGKSLLSSTASNEQTTKKSILKNASVSFSSFCTKTSVLDGIEPLNMITSCSLETNAIVDSSSTSLNDKTAKVNNSVVHYANEKTNNKLYVDLEPLDEDIDEVDKLIDCNMFKLDNAIENEKNSEKSISSLCSTSEMMQLDKVVNNEVDLPKLSETVNSGSDKENDTISSINALSVEEIVDNKSNCHLSNLFDKSHSMFVAANDQPFFANRTNYYQSCTPNVPRVSSESDTIATLKVSDESKCPIIGNLIDKFQTISHGSKNDRNETVSLNTTQVTIVDVFNNTECVVSNRLNVTGVTESNDAINNSLNLNYKTEDHFVNVMSGSVKTDENNTFTKNVKPDTIDMQTVNSEDCNNVSLLAAECNKSACSAIVSKTTVTDSEISHLYSIELPSSTIMTEIDTSSNVSRRNIIQEIIVTDANMEMSKINSSVDLQNISGKQNVESAVNNLTFLERSFSNRKTCKNIECEINHSENIVSSEDGILNFVTTGSIMPDKIEEETSWREATTETSELRRKSYAASILNETETSLNTDIDENKDNTYKVEESELVDDLTENETHTNSEKTDIVSREMLNTFPESPNILNDILHSVKTNIYEKEKLKLYNLDLKYSQNVTNSECNIFNSVDVVNTEFYQKCSLDMKSRLFESTRSENISHESTLSDAEVNVNKNDTYEIENQEFSINTDKVPCRISLSNKETDKIQKLDILQSSKNISRCEDEILHVVSENVSNEITLSDAEVNVSKNDTYEIENQEFSINKDKVQREISLSNKETDKIQKFDILQSSKNISRCEDEILHVSENLSNETILSDVEVSVNKNDTYKIENQEFSINKDKVQREISLSNKETDKIQKLDILQSSKNISRCEDEILHVLSENLSNEITLSDAEVNVNKNDTYEIENQEFNINTDKVQREISLSNKETDKIQKFDILQSSKNISRCEDEILHVSENLSNETILSDVEVSVNKNDTYKIENQEFSINKDKVQREISLSNKETDKIQKFDILQSSKNISRCEDEILHVVDKTEHTAFSEIQEDDDGVHNLTREIEVPEVRHEHEIQDEIRINTEETNNVTREILQKSTSGNNSSIEIVDVTFSNGEPPSELYSSYVENASNKIGPLLVDLDEISNSEFCAEDKLRKEIYGDCSGVLQVEINKTDDIAFNTDTDNLEVDSVEKVVITSSCQNNEKEFSFDGIKLHDDKQRRISEDNSVAYTVDIYDQNKMDDIVSSPLNNNNEHLEFYPVQKVAIPSACQVNEKEAPFDDIKLHDDKQPSTSEEDDSVEYAHSATCDTALNSGIENLIKVDSLQGVVTSTYHNNGKEASLSNGNRQIDDWTDSLLVTNDDIVTTHLYSVDEDTGSSNDFQECTSSSNVRIQSVAENNCETGKILSSLIGISQIRNFFKISDPISDYTNVDGVKRLFEPISSSSPFSSYNNVEEVKSVMNRRSPRNDYVDMAGVRRLFQNSSPQCNFSVDNIENLFISDDGFLEQSDSGKSLTTENFPSATTTTTTTSCSDNKNEPAVLKLNSEISASIKTNSDQPKTKKVHFNQLTDSVGFERENNGFEQQNTKFTTNTINDDDDVKPFIVRRLLRSRSQANFGIHNENRQSVGGKNLKGVRFQIDKNDDNVQPTSIRTRSTRSCANKVDNQCSKEIDIGNFETAVTSSRNDQEVKIKATRGNDAKVASRGKQNAPLADDEAAGSIGISKRKKTDREHDKEVVSIVSDRLDVEPAFTSKRKIVNHNNDRETDVMVKNDKDTKITTRSQRNNRLTGKQAAVVHIVTSRRKKTDHQHCDEETVSTVTNYSDVKDAVKSRRKVVQHNNEQETDVMVKSDKDIKVATRSQRTDGSTSEQVAGSIINPKRKKTACELDKDTVSTGKNHKDVDAAVTSRRKIVVQNNNNNEEADVVVKSGKDNKVTTGSQRSGRTTSELPTESITTLKTRKTDRQHDKEVGSTVTSGENVEPAVTCKRKIVRHKNDQKVNVLVNSDTKMATRSRQNDRLTSEQATEPIGTSKRKKPNQQRDKEVVFTVTNREDVESAGNAKRKMVHYQNDQEVDGTVRTDKATTIATRSKQKPCKTNDGEALIITTKRRKKTDLQCHDEVGSAVVINHKDVEPAVTTRRKKTVYNQNNQQAEDMVRIGKDSKATTRSEQNDRPTNGEAAKSTVVRPVVGTSKKQKIDCQHDAEVGSLTVTKQKAAAEPAITTKGRKIDSRSNRKKASSVVTNDEHVESTAVTEVGKKNNRKQLEEKENEREDDNCYNLRKRTRRIIN